MEEVELRLEVSDVSEAEVDFAWSGQDLVLLCILPLGIGLWGDLELARVVAVERLVQVVEREGVEWDFAGGDMTA